MTQQEEQLHRDKYYIVNDILQIVRYNPIVKRRSRSGIGYAAGLTHSMTVRYLRGLIENGLLRISYDIEQYGHYEITESGIKYLHVFEEIQDDLKPANNVTS